MIADASKRADRRFAGEIWGALAAMLVALPSAIAYGIASYAPLGAGHHAAGALAGLLGAMALGTVAAIFGGTPRLISGPCAPAAAVMAVLAGHLLAGKHGETVAEHLMLLLPLVGLLAGGLQVLYGAIGGGRLIKYIPYPVVSGYLSSVGLLIFLGQLPKLFGLPHALSTWQGLTSPAHWQWQGLVVGATTMVSMLAAPRIVRAVPAAIIGLAAGILCYFALGFLDRGLWQLEGNRLVIGPVGAGSLFSGLAARWHALGDLQLGDLRPLLAPGLTLSILLSIDTLKTCVAVDALTRTRHNSNRELVGQGLGNLVAAVVGGMPGSGTMGPTLVNATSGGRTRLSGVLEGVFVVVAALLLGELIAWVPIAALAGILILVAFRMLDRSSLHLLRQRSTVLDFLVIAAVVVVALTLNLIAAAGAGLALAIFLFIREQIRGSVIRRKVHGNQVSSKQHRLPAQKEILERDGALTTICELQGSLFFGTTDQLFTELEPDLKTSRHLILDMRRVQSVDFTAVHLLEQIEAALTERGAHLVFSSLPAALPTGQDLQVYFDQVGLVRPSQNVKIFDTLDEALEWTEERILEEAQMSHQGLGAPLELPEIELLRELESPDTLDALRSCMEGRSYRAGETIFRRGDEGDELFLIRRGVVRISLPLDGGKHLCLATFARGNFFGDMAFLDRGARSADAVAQTDTDLFVLSRARFNEMSKAQPLVGVKVFARLARALAIRLRYTDNELRVLQES